MNISGQKKRGINMGSLKNIVQHLEENQREYEKLGIENRDSYLNEGWLECARFFFRNFDVEEKTIQQEGE